MKVVKVTTPEYLSNDIFEEDFLRTFLVLHRVQFIMGTCRVDAKHRFATPPTVGQKCYTIFCVIITAIGNFALVWYFVSMVKHPIIRNLALSNISTKFIAFWLNVAHVRFFNSDQNVEFFVKMQKIDRLLKIDQWEVFNEWVRKFTNVPVALTLIVFVVLMALACGEQGLICLTFFGTAYSILTVIFELTACSSIIAYFVFRIRFINSLMENHLAQEKSPKAIKSFISKAYTRYLAKETQNCYETSDTNIYLRELFKCFTMYQDLYRFQVIMFLKTVKY